MGRKTQPTDISEHVGVSNLHVLGTFRARSDTNSFSNRNVHSAIKGYGLNTSSLEKYQIVQLYVGDYAHFILLSHDRLIANVHRRIYSPKLKVMTQFNSSTFFVKTIKL